MTESGFLVMADITGYTGYLNDSELDHAQESVVAILDVIMTSTSAPLRLSRVVGDAVISYGLDHEILNFQTLIEGLESIYVVFRRALDQMVLNTTCNCNACANLNSLDLKFVVHHGAFAISEMAGNPELIGPDVNKLFRLAKNTIREDLGFQAYIAYTSDAATALDLSEFVSTLTTLDVDTAEFGVVRLHVADMHPVWERRRNELIVDISEANTMLTFAREIQAPVGVVWDHLTDPAKRSRIFASESASVSKGVDGKMGVDGTYVCAHGKMRIPHRIIDWIPLSQYTFHSEGPFFHNLWQFRLTGRGEATELGVTVGRTEYTTPLAAIAGIGWRRYTRRTTIKGLNDFAKSIEKEHAAISANRT